MSDLTYVVYGQWDDVEWRFAAAKPVSQRTPAEHELYRNGPRVHPWGPLARSVVQADGSVLVFPSQEAADAYAAAQAPTLAPAAVVAPVAIVDPFHADPGPEAPAGHPSEDAA